MKEPPKFLLRRILEKGRLTPSGCIEFRNGVDPTNGYARIGKLRAHRAIWQWLYGPLPDHLHIDHLCRNKICVNPEHLEPVTSRENTLRGLGFAAINAAATHCPLGHAYAGANLASSGKVKKFRDCRICKMARQTAARGRKTPLLTGKVGAALAEHVARQGNGHLTPKQVFFDAVNAFQVSIAAKKCAAALSAPGEEGERNGKE